MTYTALPSIKGQITLPVGIREKYNIGKNTPVVIEDTGNGLITLKIMGMVEQDDIQYYENPKEIGLHFKNGIDPKMLIKAIKKLDGQNP